MVELRAKVGPKGQILIPKVLRDRYRVREGGTVMLEPRDDGLLVKGKPSIEEIENALRQHISKLGDLGIKGAKLGELKKVYLEMEFEEVR